MEHFEREERRGTNFVVDAVEEPRDHGEDGGLKGLHVVWQESDVTLEKSHSATSPIYHRLKWQRTWVNSGDDLYSLRRSGPHLHHPLEHVS